jgi:hypothetical protein
MAVGNERYVQSSLPLEKSLVTHLTGGWVGLGGVWTVTDILANSGFRTPNCPACSESMKITPNMNTLHVAFQLPGYIAREDITQHLRSKITFCSMSFKNAAICFKFTDILL